MAQELQKQSGGTLTFQKQPEAFLTQVGTYLETLQKVYRTKLPPDELVIWAETLKDYSYQEFDRAMKHLITNPPKYEIDGDIQVWRGMPKLPDVVDVMLNFREEDVRLANAREAERQRQEFRELEKRRAEHPEEFVTWQEVCEAAAAENPAVAKLMQPDRNGVKVPGRPMPPPMDDAAWERRRAHLRSQIEQAKAVARKHEG